MVKTQQREGNKVEVREIYLFLSSLLHNNILLYYIFF